MPDGPRTNPYAVASIVLGLAGIPFYWLVGLPSGAALVLGVLGLRQIRASGGGEVGTKFAVWGIVLGGLVVVIDILLVTIGPAIHRLING